MPLAIMIDRTGGPEMLKPVDVAVPEPQVGEVRIRQAVAGVNFVDIYHRTGLYALPPGQAVLGIEGGGTVEAVGPGVDGFRVGDRIAYMGFPPGGYAELRTLPAARLVRLPDGVDTKTAGSSMARGLTAFMLLHRVRPVREGEWILMHAAAGGVGQLVTRWARRLGARVVGTVGSAAKAEIARAAGAEEVLLHTSEDWPQEVRRIADGRGVHLAIDGIGGPVLARTLDTVRPFGTVASIGQPAGPVPPIEVAALGFPRSISVGRPSVLAFANDPDLYREGAEALIAALADGLANPIGAEYPLAEAAQAQRDLEAGRTTGSVVLIP